VQKVKPKIVEHQQNIINLSELQNKYHHCIKFMTAGFFSKVKQIFNHLLTSGADRQKLKVGLFIKHKKGDKNACLISK